MENEELTNLSSGGGERSSIFYFDNPSDHKLQMTVGEVREIHVYIGTNNDNKMPQVTFTSSNNFIATVSRSQIAVAKVTAKFPGTVTIKATFTSASGNYYEDSLTLNVIWKGEDVNYKDVPEDHRIWMAVGETTTLTLHEKPTDTDFNSSNTDIATVKKTAVNKASLVAVSPGICLVRALTKESLNEVTCTDVYYVIVTHGNGTNYLDILSFETADSWEAINLGSVFVVGCSKDETSDTTFKTKMLSPESWRNLIDRSYKELKVSKAGQDINIKVTPDKYLEDQESEVSWISSHYPEDIDATEIFCDFIGLGVYKFNVQSNCPVRFKTACDKISLGPWTGEVRSEYILSDYGNNRVLPVHVLELPTAPETIEITYECTNGKGQATLKVNLWPPLPGLVDIRGPYIYIVPGERTSYNQRIEIKSYGDNLVYRGIEYPTERGYYRYSDEQLATMWTSNLSSAHRTIKDCLKVNLSPEIVPCAREDTPGARKYYITLKSVTGYEPDELPTAPVARLKFEVPQNTEYPFERINSAVKNYIYYYIYVLPQVPLRNIDTYEKIGSADEVLDNWHLYGFKTGIFERLITNDLNATWPGTDVKFIDISGMYDCFNVRYPSGSEAGDRNNYGVQLEIAWSDTQYSWEHRTVGSELGTLVIKWYYNKDHILKHHGLFNYYYLSSTENFTTVGNPPYFPNDQFYTQTIHFVKEESPIKITNADTLLNNYPVTGTYDRETLNPDYAIIRTNATFNATITNGPYGYYQYFFREEEIYDTIPVRYTCEVSPENSSSLNLTIEPRGNNVSFAFSNYEDLIPYYSVAEGAIKIVKEGKEKNGRGGREYKSVVATYSFTQDGLDDCIVFKDKIYLGRAEISLPDVSADPTQIKIGGLGISSYKISEIVDLEGQVAKARPISNGIKITVWKNDDAAPTFSKIGTTFTDLLDITENLTGSEITYTIEISHVEQTSSSIESRLIIKLKQNTKSSNVRVNDTDLPFIYSYGSLSKPLEFYTSIPKNKIWVEEVIGKDSQGKWIVNQDFEKPRIVSSISEHPDDSIPSGYRCYKCYMNFSPNSNFIIPEDNGDNYEDTIRRIRIRHVDVEGSDLNVFELKQGYYCLYPTLMYKTENEDDFTIVQERDSRGEEVPDISINYDVGKGIWQIGSRSNPVELPPFRNAGSGEDTGKVWISLMALRHEIDYDNIEWVNTTELLNRGLMEIEENTRKLYPDTIEGAGAVLSEKDWFSNIQTDLVIHSTDATSEYTKRVLGDIPEEDTGEDIEFPALETIYTVSGAGFYERRVLIQEDIELGLGVLKKEGGILYDGPKAYTVNSKIQIWYRKIGEDIKDE